MTQRYSKDSDNEGSNVTKTDEGIILMDAKDRGWVVKVMPQHRPHESVTNGWWIRRNRLEVRLFVYKRNGQFCMAFASGVDLNSKQEVLNYLKANS